MKTGSEKWKRLVEQGAHDIGIHIDSDTADQFAVHAEALLTWSRKSNLTAIKDPLEVAVKHFIDSMAPARYITLETTLLDIGSGGGFPGIPLKILVPSLSVTLIDASRKKVSFLNHVIGTLGLDNINARHIRAEDLAKEHCTYDVIISRAFSSLATYVKLALPLLSEGGQIIAMKGKETSEEMDSLATLSATLSDGRTICMNNLDMDVKAYSLPFIQSRRTLYLFNLKNIHFGIFP